MTQKISEVVERCETCGRDPRICVCDRTPHLNTRLRVLILQHPQEQDVDVGSAKLAAASLAKAKLCVGFSWGSLARALDEKDADPTRWAVLWPDNKQPVTTEHVLVNRHGDGFSKKKLQGIVVLDGTWSQAKTLWWRNAWLLKLARLTLHPSEPSAYGRMRKEPKKHFVSTLESVGEALTYLGEPDETQKELVRVFRTLVQRARDLKGAR